MAPAEATNTSAISRTDDEGAEITWQSLSTEALDHQEDPFLTNIITLRRMLAEQEEKIRKQMVMLQIKTRPSLFDQMSLAHVKGLRSRIACHTQANAYERRLDDKAATIRKQEKALSEQASKLLEQEKAAQSEVATHEKDLAERDAKIRDQQAVIDSLMHKAHRMVIEQREAVEEYYQELDFCHKRVKILTRRNEELSLELRWERILIEQAEAKALAVVGHGEEA